VAALQAALDGGGTVSVDTPGVYDLNQTLFLDSNTRLVCCPGVVFRKVAPYCNVLVNRGALTKQYNDNIVIDGLEISVNGQEASPTLVYGLRAQVGFFYVRNLTLRNFTCVDGGAHQFLIYIVTWSNLLIENVRLAGDKDGIKLNNGHDAVIRNLDLTTYDDGMSLCGTDYPSVLLEVGDVYNVRYINVTDHQYKDIFGRTCLIYTGSWADYQDGNRYGTGDFCLSAGKLYQVVNEGFAAVASTAAPVHASGVVTAADGIAWRFIQPCDFYQTHVYNVSFENCIFEKSGNLVANWITPRWMYERGDCVHRNSYPGTEANSTSWGITIANCRVTGAGPQVLVNLMGNMRDVMIAGCYFGNPRSTVINVDPDSVNEELVATLNGCLFRTSAFPAGAVAGGGAATVPDYQGCPILRRDIDDAGKLIVVHNGSKVHCQASGNLYHGAPAEVAVTQGSRLRLSNPDLPLRNIGDLSPEPGDLCRGLGGLYLYEAAGWVRLRG
jgi:hypothetical protein